MELNGYLFTDKNLLLKSDIHTSNYSIVNKCIGKWQIYERAQTKTKTMVSSSCLYLKICEEINYGIPIKANKNVYLAK